jgi:AraC family transcriptional regulator
VITQDTFYLKNMLSYSCIKLIEMVFIQKESVRLLSIVLGEVSVEYDNEIISKNQIIDIFKDLNFDIVRDPDVEIVEKTKIAAIEIIHKSFNANSLIRNSEYISDKLQLPYDKISKVFSQVTGSTLEKYIILLKIEKAKEMIVNNEYNLSEISYMLGYSSVHYLSNQFKKSTGVTVSQFKDNPSAYRKKLEELI